jgi:hypothetical protein
MPFQFYRAVAGSAPDDIWAVGSTGNGEVARALVSHWDGRAWSNVPLPDLGTYSRLYGVAPLNPRDVWAVGSVGDPLHKPQRTLALHWDGTGWSVVPTPNFAQDNINELKDVAAIAPDDVWAVGYYEPSANCVGCKEAILIHWNGRDWTRVDIPGLIPMRERGYSTLESIAVISKNDIWAVGTKVANNNFNPLSVHWDGTQWSMVPVPQVSGVLYGVAALAADDVWAVGNIYPDQFTIDTLIMHWDGRQWSVMPAPSRITEPAEIRETLLLYSVAVRSPDEVWVMGYLSTPRSGSRMTLLRWNGRAWQEVHVPGIGEHLDGSAFYDAAVIGGDLWLVGNRDMGLLVRYSKLPCHTPAPTTKPLNPPVPLPGSGSITFPQTGKMLSGIFLKYWQEHGGLMQQGYPISDVIGEVSDLDGKLYTVQYFERAVFEYHPEHAGTPYEVLLSQLGTFEYRRKYPNGAPDQRPNTSPGSVLFPQTGKRLGGVFLGYWRTHGGLMQQGYPISDEFTEISPLDGRAYTVQYFERAVFEYHPEYAGTPYEVLLSHLGRFRWEKKYPGNP